MEMDVNVWNGFNGMQIGDSELIYGYSNQCPMAYALHVAGTLE